jgi:PKD repeat protein
MFVNRGSVTRLMLVACLTAILAGCPWTGDNGLALLLTPQVLNFEDDQDSLTFQVHRNLTNSPVEPVVVSSNQPWIVLELCTDSADNCLGFGIVDQLYIPVRVDRNQMLLGTNRGEVIVRTGGAGDQKITVYAEDVLEVDFLVNNRRPATGQAVSFQDASEKTDDAGDVVSRLWDFGDGNTSTATDPVHVYNTPGLYSISLTVTTANAEETIRKAAWITVGSPAPTVEFEVDKTNIYEGESIIFTDLSVTSTEPVTGVLWDFGDGRTSTDGRPSHQYTEPGVFTVSLTVSTANASETETKTNLIVVQRKLAPVARIAVNPASPVALAPARFSDISDAGSAEIQQWFWDFGDGATSSVQHPTHTFAAGGDYEVTLYVVSAHGSNTVTTTVTVITIPPTAAFTISDSTPFILTPVTFTDASTDGSAPIEQYNWEFGDGASSNEQNPVHTYNSSGTFVVRLTVISDHGSNSTTQSVTVSFMPPVANFSGTPRSPSVGQAVQFQDLSRPGTAAVNQWLWDFGDPDSEENNLSNLQNPSHTYNAPGFYTVTLTVRTPVTTDNSDTEVKTAYIQVVQAPIPDFSFEVTDPETPNILQFTSETVAGSEPIIATLWNFGDPGSGIANTNSARKAISP